MFCFQCEQTTRGPAGAGCATDKGVCGKDEATADLQDVLIHQLKGIGQYVSRLRTLGVADAAADTFILYGLFTTLTNVNFNRGRFVELISEAARLRDRLRTAFEAAAKAAGQVPEALSGPAAFVPADNITGLLAQANVASVIAGRDVVGEDVIGLRALLLYGLKGVAAYAHHAEVLGESRDEIAIGIAHALDVLASNPTDLGDMLEEALALGRLNFKVMETLDAANTGSFGTPSPHAVRTTPVEGKAILVSGHDFRDLHELLEATKGTGINVYTHGEMLPAHGYPKLREYSHLAGNYGGAWQNQQIEFAAFPGPIVMTSNCLIEPQPLYRNRIFTSGPVGWPGVRHVTNGDYAAVVQAAKALPGFTKTMEGPSLTVGFGRDAVLGAAGTVVEAVKSGAIRHFFLIGGLPRLLDIGQCNDTYSALVIATALAGAFNCGVNELPLSLVISWFEQKAAAVFLTLLALGVRNVRLGPTLPAFLTPAILDILVNQFGVLPITTAEADIKAALTPLAAE